MERVKIINDISSTLEKSREDLSHVLKKLGWDKEGLEKDEKGTVCPVDSSHVMPSSSFAKHVEKCRMKKECIDSKTVCPSSHFFYKNSLAVVPVLIDKKKYESFKILKKEPDRNVSMTMEDRNKPWQCIPSDIDDIVHGTTPNQHLTSNNEPQIIQKVRSKADPEITMYSKIRTPHNEISGSEESLQEVQTAVDIQLPMSKVLFDLTPAQRLALYDYVVQTAKAVKRRAAEDELDELQSLAENTGETEKEEPKSHLDALAEMRDYKRRRQSYRAKNVHMTKRTNVEVMRDLIETQMKMLEELNKGKESPRTRFDNNVEKDAVQKENSKEHDKYRGRRKNERSRDRDNYTDSKHSLL